MQGLDKNNKDLQLFRIHPEPKQVPWVILQAKGRLQIKLVSAKKMLLYKWQDGTIINHNVRCPSQPSGLQRGVM